MELDLNNHRTSNAKIFAGRDRGKAVRISIGEKIIDDAEAINLHIPDDVYTINSSFFLGLFGKTIRKHGRDRFNQILNPNTSDFAQSINDAIREALESEVLL